MEKIQAVDGDRLDLICWKHYGSLEHGVVETVLDANPGLAMGKILKAGQEITLPPIVARPTEQSLW